MSYDFYRAILHIDGDAFFASCEQSTNMSLRNKPIVVGYERGCATAYSYEAKAQGIIRGMSIQKIQEEHPDAILVNSDYRKYSLFSARMKQIVSRFTNKIEKTSIDECYVDITGLDQELDCTYEEVCQKIQDELCTSLGMTFSLGLGSTKVLAKIGSGLNKPHGITILNKQTLEKELYPLSIGRVGGIGYRTEPKLNKLGIFTIKHFIQKDRAWLDQHLSKPYKEVHAELSGKLIRPLESSQKNPKSISKIHAFSEPTNDKEFLLTELSRNIELILQKMKRCNLGACRISCGLKTFDGMTYTNPYTFDGEVHDFKSLYGAVQELFFEIYNPRKKFRATYVCVSQLKPASKQSNLFDSNSKAEETNSDIQEAISDIDNTYGARTVQLLSSKQLNKKEKRSNLGTPLITSLTGDKVLYIPSLGVL